jgi:serine/threonine protein kinase
VERKQFFVIKFVQTRSCGCIHNNNISSLRLASMPYQSDTDNTSVKICDFGFAKRVHMPQSLTTLCGSLFYVAPELLKNHPYDESADMWSVGVIIFFLLGGYLVS